MRRGAPGTRGRPAANAGPAQLGTPATPPIRLREATKSTRYRLPASTQRRPHAASRPNRSADPPATSATGSTSYERPASSQRRSHAATRPTHATEEPRAAPIDSTGFRRPGSGHRRAHAARHASRTADPPGTATTGRTGCSRAAGRPAHPHPPKPRSRPTGNKRDRSTVCWARADGGRRRIRAAASAATSTQPIRVGRKHLPQLRKRPSRAADRGRLAPTAAGGQPPHQCPRSAATPGSARRRW
ncbi:hypothetical protein I4F81_001238 [Pyropia yezoensis]|uniref:Uncharacterized protein n=1 Tax=Pyropia yezoensis TaxID=2788 RepID=A0ACC3BLE5_PYRYE|nr:hypothetical protein I4F81_001238 [Neopyropia yezoensis]